MQAEAQRVQLLLILYDFGGDVDGGGVHLVRWSQTVECVLFVDDQRLQIASIQHVVIEM